MPKKYSKRKRTKRTKRRVNKKRTPKNTQYSGGIWGNIKDRIAPEYQSARKNRVTNNLLYEIYKTYCNVNNISVKDFNKIKESKNK